MCATAPSMISSAADAAKSVAEVSPYTASAYAVKHMQDGLIRTTIA